jgi:hypothetical protein
MQWFSGDDQGFFKKAVVGNGALSMTSGQKACLKSPCLRLQEPFEAGLCPFLKKPY